MTRLDVAVLAAAGALCATVGVLVALQHRLSVATGLFLVLCGALVVGYGIARGHRL